MKRLQALLDKYYELGIREQIDYDKFYLYSIITHSTAIEGSTVTEIENRLLFDEGISSSKPITEQLMNLDLKKGYERAFEIAEGHETVTVETLCELSGIIMNNTGSEYHTISGNFSSAKGNLRLINVSAGRGGKSYLSWKKVPERLQEFCEWLKKERAALTSKNAEQIYILSFEVHYRLVTIHPWADGNGRMARLLMNLIQYEAGLIPSIVRKESRIQYFQALSDAQAEKKEQVFLEFMMEHHLNNLEMQIREYKESSENDTIKENGDTLNDTLNLSEKERLVLSLIREDSQITIDDLSSGTGFGRATITRAIKSLKEKNLLGRAGSKKNGYWTVF